MSIVLVVVAALLGSLAGFLAVKRGLLPRRWGLIAALCAIAVLAAVSTNATQRLLDAGFDFTLVDIIEAASYFIFGFSNTAAWALFRPSPLRWVLFALIPVAMIEPLHWAMVGIAWAMRRLG